MQSGRFGGRFFLMFPGGAPTILDFVRLKHDNTGILPRPGRAG
jgi:hypothetical protein